MRSGVSIIEVIVGCAIFVLVVYGGAYSLKPLHEANRKFRLTSRAHKLEDEIRRSIYYQSNYSNPSGFTIEVNGVILAREGETRYLKEDLSESKTVVSEYEKKTTFPLATKVAFVSDTNLPTGYGILYQVQASDEGLGMATFGSNVWPTDFSTYITTHHSTDHAIIDVPEELAESIAKNCNAGIMRGLRRNVAGGYDAVCWEYEAVASLPPWSIPTALTFDDLTNKIKLQYSPLNRPACPSMSITDNSGKTWNLPNFFAFSNLDMRDLFPAKAANSVLASECERVIDFYKDSETGVLPKALVDNPAINKNPGFCPDKNLYVLNPVDGSCSLHFSATAIPNRIPARAAP